MGLKLSSGIRTVLSSLLVLALFLAVDGWVFALSYADWLRFSSPNAPDVVTGQVVYVKAARGVFYATRAQAWWSVGISPWIWLGGAAAVLGAATLGNGGVAAGRPGDRFSVWIGAISIVAIVAGATCLFFPDHLFAVLMTHSLKLPPEPPPGLTVVPPGR